MTVWVGEEECWIFNLNKKERERRAEKQQQRVTEKEAVKETGLE